MRPPTISITPGPDAWRSAMATRRDAFDADRALLGLPTDQPVVMSGHQPIVWHAGILTKLLAASELAEQTGAAVCWIVADMDEVDPTTVRVPAGSCESATSRIVRTLAGDPPGPGVPPGALPTREAVADDDALDGLAPLLDAYVFEPTLAMQVGQAVVYGAVERFGIEPPTVISCSDLTRTDAWRAFVGAMTDDAGSCVAAYNRAVASHPDARMRELQSRDGRHELPLWRVRDGMARLAVFSDQIGAIPFEELRPRALAMTALVRAALCELFVHGIGGGMYDRITEDWFAGWAGSPGWDLAPTSVATGDAFADLGIDPDSLPDPSDAIWRAHHARHDPALLGDDDAARMKRDLVARIASIKAGGGDPAPEFRALHDVLREARARHADRLGELEDQARRARALADVRALALDRTWAWPTLPDETLDALHASIRGWFGSVPSEPCTDASP